MSNLMIKQFVRDVRWSINVIVAINVIYYQWLTAQICIYFTSVVIFVLIGYLGDDIIGRMASVEIPFPSVVYVMFNYCHVIVYVQIEK